MVFNMFIIIVEFIVFFIPHHHFSYFLLVFHCVSLFLITPQSFSSLFSIFRVIQHHASSFFMLFIMFHPFSLFIIVHSCQYFFIIFIVFITFHDFPSSCCVFMRYFWILVYILLILRIVRVAVFRHPNPQCLLIPISLCLFDPEPDIFQPLSIF